MNATHGQPARIVAHVAEPTFAVLCNTPTVAPTSQTSGTFKSTKLSDTCTEICTLSRALKLQIAPVSLNSATDTNSLCTWSRNNPSRDFSSFLSFSLFKPTCLIVLRAVKLVRCKDHGDLQKTTCVRKANNSIYKWNEEETRKKIIKIIMKLSFRRLFPGFPLSRSVYVVMLLIFV